MENRPSSDPRDQAIRAALADAASLAAMVATDFRASYRGPERDLYRATLGEYVVDLGGRLEDRAAEGLVADFAGREIAIRFS